MTTKTRQPRGITGVRLGYIPPGSDEWRKYMTASKIAAVMGHSPYESRFSLWHRSSSWLLSVTAGASCTA